ncbi:MAG: cysteine synthase family protein [Dehalococcoidia bacterium]|nr:cysteine synthase family protein [Dehalococcoidia bacterium]
MPEPSPPLPAAGDPLLARIGNTPLVELPNCSPKPGIRIYAKLEWFNPSGSVKDRIAWYMLERAEAEGLARPGMTVVEATTGNTGIALTLACRRKGYGVKTVVPENAMPEILELLAAHGAEVITGPPGEGTRGAIRLARELAEAPHHLNLDQFSNQANVQAHYLTTGPEILAALPEVDVFVAGTGTGGTITGVGRRLREHNPAVQLVAMEPHLGSQVQGLRSLQEGFIPPILDLEQLSGKILVYSKDAFFWTRELARREGLFGGLSSGAALYGALKWAQRLEHANIVVLFADAGWKYLSTGLWRNPTVDSREGLDDTVWW